MLIASPDWSQSPERAAAPRAKAPQAHPRQPSPRNIEIYGHVKLMGEPRAQAAERYGVTPERISQICRQVHVWQEWAKQRPQTTASLAERQLVQRQLARVRCEQLLTLVVRELLNTKRELVTERQINVGGVVTIDRRVRPNPLGVQWLKLALRLSNDLAQYEAELPPHERFSATPIGQELQRRVAEIGAELCRQTLRPGQLPAAADGREIPNLSHSISANQGVESPAISAMPPAATRCDGPICGGAAGERGEAVADGGREKIRD